MPRDIGPAHRLHAGLSPKLQVTPLAAMKVAVAVSLFMVDICMILVVITIPAVVVTPVPAIVCYKFASMLPAMLALVFACMRTFAVGTIAAPFIAPKTIIISDDRPTSSGCKTSVLMFSVRR